MDIKKETFVNANEETTKELTFDLLYGLHEKLDEQNKLYKEHLPKCEKRFKGLEDRKKLDTAISGGAGLAGGIIAGIAQWLRGLI